MNILVSSRVQKVKYAVRNVARAAHELEKKGRKLLYLNIGDPGKYDFPTPPHILDACRDALYAQQNYYAFSSGVQEAREAIARSVRVQKISVSPEQVVITTGVSEGIDIVMQILLNPGENILMPLPNYPLYEAVAHKIGAEPHFYSLDEENGWEPDIDDVRTKITPKTRAILLINPNNPTGGVYRRKTVKALVDVAAEHNLPILSDEIYDHLLFDGEVHIPTASVTCDVPVITFNGLSKNYLAPGWRVGWMTLNNIQPTSTFAAAVNNLVDARLCSPTPPQFAIKAALEGPQNHVKGMVRKMQERGGIIFKWLNEIDGLSCVKPRGAFYAFPRIEKKKYPTDEQFVLELMKQQGVVVVHGSGFGQKAGTQHFRIVFLPPPDVLHRALDKVEKFMNG